jgi:hypothetical protein
MTVEAKNPGSPESAAGFLVDRVIYGAKDGKNENDVSG